MGRGGGLPGEYARMTGEGEVRAVVPIGEGRRASCPEKGE